MESWPGSFAIDCTVARISPRILIIIVYSELNDLCFVVSVFREGSCDAVCYPLVDFSSSKLHGL